MKDSILISPIAVEAKLLIALIAIVSAISCGGGRSSESVNADGNSPAGQPIAVTTASVETREIPAYIQATGSLVADETSDVAPKSAGRIKNVFVDVGDFIGQGATIAQMDDRDALLQLATAKANVKQAIAAVRQAEARLGLDGSARFNASSIPEVRAANANYQQLLAELKQAETNEKRYRDLVETGDVAMITYETFRTTRDSAKARDRKSVV